MNERVEWKSTFYFLMACIGAAVGLGNIWRFPYLFYSGGQGSFMIPYIIAILVIGFPFMFVEFAVGYKFKKPVVDIFRSMDKRFKILAWIIFIVVFLIMTYYVVIISWDLDYLFLSFFNGWGANPDLFFTNTLLHTSSSIYGIFEFVPYLLIGLLVTWVILWLILSRDLNSGIGRFSAIFVPILFFLCIGLTVYEVFLPGASIGYMMFFKPDWRVLGDLNIWLTAFGQVCFTLSLGYTLTINYASHLPEGTNLPINTFRIILANCGFEIINAIGIFSIIGFMSYSSGIPFNNIITEGTGLAFVALPSIFNVLGTVGRIIGPLFFFAILISGISSAIACFEPFVDSMESEFNISRKKAVTILIGICFLISLLFTTRASTIILSYFDFFINNILVLILIIVQCVLFGFIYKRNDLIEVLNRNSRFKIMGSWLTFIIKYIIPVVLAILIVYGIYQLVIDINLVAIVIYISLTLFTIIFALILNHYCD